MLKTLSRLKSMCNTVKTPVRHYAYPKVFHQYLQNMPSANYTKLDNGLTVATERRDSCNTCVGLFIDGGSRYEDHHESGISTLFEYLAFKGTCSKPRPIIEECIMNTGARFRSFTTREMVGYYADVLLCDIPCAIEILSDSIFHNALNEMEVQNQKNLLYMDMLKHDSDSNTLVDEFLHATAFQGTNLQNTVYGISYNLENFTQNVIQTYLYRNFHPSYTVLAVVGAVEHEQIVNFARNCTSLSEVRTTACRLDGYYRYTGSEMKFRNDDLPFCNVAIALEGPAFWNDDRIIMDIAATIIGGWDKRQIWGRDNANVLAHAVSEDHLCEAFKSFNINYKDTGLWGVQFIGRSLDLENMMFNIQNEWMRLCTMITENEVKRAKHELKTKILSKTESTIGNCIDLGRWTLYKGFRPTLHDQLTAIDRIKAEDVMKTCTEFIYDRCPVVAAVGPCEGLPEYTRIRSGMYWLRF